MPRLWHDTIEAHRRGVRDAVLDTTAALVADHGLLSVTMSRIAEETGIGRATLYKYFPDVEAILLAWHEQHIARHFEHLADVRDRAENPADRLHAVLGTYALMRHEMRHFEDTGIPAVVHRDPHVAAAESRLRDLVKGLLTDAVASGDVRADVGADELVTYVLHALNAASRLPSKVAVRRLVDVTLRGLEPG